MNTTEEIATLLAAKAAALIAQAPKPLAEILDPNFIYVNSLGTRSTKQQYLDLYCHSGKMKFQAQKVEELEVQDFGAFAVATMILQDQFEFMGKSYSGTFRSLCVFKKVNDRWLWTAGQAMVTTGTP